MLRARRCGAATRTAARRRGGGASRTGRCGTRCRRCVGRRPTPSRTASARRSSRRSTASSPGRRRSRPRGARAARRRGRGRPRWPARSAGATGHRAARRPRRRRPSRRARRAPVSNEIPAVTNRSNASANTSTHPSRRQRRVSHGADAVTIATMAARPGPAREAGAAQPVERVGDVDDALLRDRVRTGRGGTRRRPRPRRRAPA